MLRTTVYSMRINLRRIKPSYVIQRSRLLSSQPVNMLSDTRQSLIKKKMDQLVQWYEETTGMDEVRIAQNRVLDAEDKFVNAQERRREASKEVALVQRKLKEIYAELDNTTRGEDRYVVLITEEHKLLKDERAVLEAFQNYEKEEREYFTALSSAVKESHEKERAQAERTKYWSIIGSIFGTILGILGSSINNEIRMRELRSLLKDSATGQHKESSTTVPNYFTEHEKQLSNIVSEMKLLTNLGDDKIQATLDSIHHTLSNVEKDERSRLSTLLETFQKQNALLDKNFRELKNIVALQVDKENMSNKQIMRTIDFDDNVQDENVYLKIGILVIITTFVSQLLRCFQS